MRTELRRELTGAIKARDRVAVSALRSALAAIDNAEAPDAAGHDAGVGVGATEVDRLELSDAQLVAILDAEVTQRRSAAADYDRLGRTDDAARLRAEADILGRHLPDPD